MADVCTEEVISTQKERHGLYPIYSGEETCAPGHYWGAGVRGTYLVHYVISGKGVFYCGPNKYPVQKGQIFVIFPGTIVKYQADTQNPWRYAWVGFQGDEAKDIFSQVGITLQTPVFTMQNGAEVLKLLRTMPSERGAELKQNLAFTASLYAFMSLLAENTTESVTSENVYADTAVKYIKAHYSEDLSVDQIAEHIGIGRKYLFAVFKRALGLSPKDYIIYYRIERAKEFLQNVQLPIGSIAYSVGYKDPLTFSKMFKIKTGLSPTEYRDRKNG